MASVPLRGSVWLVVPAISSYLGRATRYRVVVPTPSPFGRHKPMTTFQMSIR